MATGKMPEVGRPKKYKTAKALGDAINAYFNSIVGKGGKYTRAPSVAGLCLSLGISRSTWYSYGDDEKLKEVVDGARLVIEDYWTNQLSGKFANGAKFALGCGFGWNGRGNWNERENKSDAESGGESTGVIQISAVTPMEEDGEDA